MNVGIEGLRFDRGARTILDIPGALFASGRVTALLGANGSGKSTLLRVIAGLERPAGGQVTFDGAPVPARQRSRLLAYAFQEAVFLSGSVRANLDLALRLQRLEANERVSRIEEAAGATGIAMLLDRHASALSGGEAQRANLARALALRAPITLLDEPLTGLDAAGRRQLLHELPALLRRFTATTIVVTHDREEALRLADDLVVLAAGRILAAGPRAEVMRSPPDALTADLLGFTVLEIDGGIVAVAPGMIRPGPGDRTFELVVGSVSDLGHRLEVGGLIGGTAIRVDWSGQPPRPGERVPVSARREAVVRFPFDPLDS